MMSYSYEVERPKIFTPEGFNELMIVRDYIEAMDKLTGAVTISKIMSHLTKKVGVCNTWVAMAYIDYLVETDFIKVLNVQRATQDNVVIKKI